MTTYIQLEDGRVFSTTNGLFDYILECTAQHLEGRTECPELRDWLLDQRCDVLGPGVGYLDLRELSPIATCAFRSACTSAYRALMSQQDPASWLEKFSVLFKMWESMDRGEPPEALTSDFWQLTPFSGERKGPGWL
jgi:hypothetical protein